MKERDKLLVPLDVIEELERIYIDESPDLRDLTEHPALLAFKAGRVDVVRKLRRVYEASKGGK